MSYTADYCQRRSPTLTNPQLHDSNKNLVLGPRHGFKPRFTGRLTVRRNATLTLTSSSASLLIFRMRGDYLHTAYTT
jgi:hypothetical protein